MRKRLWMCVVAATLGGGAATLCGGVARADVPKCRALVASDGALILEVAHRSATKCTALLSAAMKKRRCARRGHPKTFEYERHYDHRGMSRRVVTESCAPSPVPTCRAVDVRSKKTIAKIAQKSSKRCASLLAEEVKKERCTKRRRGKKIAYRVRFDQRGASDRRVALVCKN